MDEQQLAELYSWSYDVKENLELLDACFTV